MLNRFNEISDEVRRADDDDEMNALLEEQGKLQDDRRGRWLGARPQARDRRRRAAPAALGRGRHQAVRRRKPPRGAVPPAAVATRHAAARRADQPPRRRIGRLAGALPQGLHRHRRRRDSRPLLPRQRRRLDPRARPRPRHSLGGQLLVLARAEGKAPRPGRARRRKEAAPAHDAARTRMGAQAIPRAPGQEQGAPQAFEELSSSTTRSATDQRDLHPAGPAPRRRGDRGEGRRKGLRRQAADRRPRPQAAARAASSASSAPTAPARRRCSA